MRFFATIATISLLASSAIAAPRRALYPRDDSAASIESLASGFASTLSASQAKLSSYSSESAALTTVVSSLSSSLSQAAHEFSAVGGAGAGANPAYLSGAMGAQIKALNASMTESRTQLAGLATTANPADLLSVNGIDTLLSALIPPVSNLFNALGGVLEGLDLPPL